MRRSAGVRESRVDVKSQAVAPCAIKEPGPSSESSTSACEYWGLGDGSMDLYVVGNIIKERQHV